MQRLGARLGVGSACFAATCLGAFTATAEPWVDRQLALKVLADELRRRCRRPQRGRGFRSIKGLLSGRTVRDCRAVTEFGEQPWHPAQRRRRAAYLAGAIAVLIAAWFGWREHQKRAATERLRQRMDADAELESMLAEARQIAAEKSEAWRRAIQSSAAREVRRDDPPCPVAIPDGLVVGIGAGLTRLGINFDGEMPALVLQADQLETRRSPRAARLMSELADVRADFANLETRPGRVRSLTAAVQTWKPDLSVIVDAEEKPSSVDFDAGTFVGGERIGRAYVYDYATGRVVCMGRFVASSSKKITVGRDLPKSEGFEVSSGFDLDRRSAEAAIASLRSVIGTERTP